MANPQKEKGYTAIANEIIEALAVIRISGEEWQCLCCILRKTYGWRKIKDAISLSQFQESTGIKKQNICRALNRLLSKNIIIVIKKDKGITEYALQKDYELWKPLSKKITLKSLSKKITPVIKKDKETAKIVIKKETHKRNIKTTITKERNPKKENWLKMIDKNLGKELSVFEKSDLEKIKKKLDAPTYERLLLILKEKDGEQ